MNFTINIYIYIALAYLFCFVDAATTTLATVVGTQLENDLFHTATAATHTTAAIFYYKRYLNNKLLCDLWL